MQVASIIPSSKALIRKVSGKIDFTKARVIAEYGPGEGCHTREILRQMRPDSHLLLFELDGELAQHLTAQFHDDPRVIVLNSDAADLPAALLRCGLEHCDYIVSGIPFSILESQKKRELLQATFDALRPEYHAAFVIYQVTNELVGHCRHFSRVESEWCVQNIPPMFVTKFYRTANGVPVNGKSAHAVNGHVAR